jgi:hypothetical protein
MAVRNKILDPNRKDAIQTNEIEYLDNDTLKAVNFYLPVVVVKEVTMF